MADIPGIIEGAAEGKGLGVRFLRHIERNSILLFMVPVTSDDILKEYEILLNELRKYNPELLDKKRIVAISQCDLVDEPTLVQLKKKIKLEVDTIFISSATKKGIEDLKNLLWKTLTN